jgi:ubiquinol-cytochrome c reductase cytochrome b subunit
VSLKNFLPEFLDEPLPEKVGWPHIFGSMLLIVFGFQFVTGLLLSFVYAPSPLSAYRSVQYLMNEMPSGAWIRGVHYWGASVLVIVMALHLIRTFLYAAYRKPRHWTWLIGVLLFLCVLTFVQTGYLLPWDQRAYWGTNVTIQIIGTVPLSGPKIAYLLRGGNAVGALTLSRFYSIHVVVLPLASTLLILAHLFFIRRYGITPPWSDSEDVPRPKRFYPYQMAKDSTGMLIVLAMILLLAWAIPAPLARPADPTDTTTVPRPDWYFYFLFQLLHYFRGKTEVIGTFVLPSLAMVALFFLPWIDRNRTRRLRKRPVALFAFLLAVGGWSWLTYLAVAGTPRPASWKRPAGIELPRAERVKRPSEVGGLYVLKQYCFECHSMTILGARADLQTMTHKIFPDGDWLQTHLQQEGRNITLTAVDRLELLSVLRVVSGDNAFALSSIPSAARFGGHLFFTHSCMDCHVIDGQGGEHNKVHAPDITLRLLRPKEWHMKHIEDASSVVPGSKMPPFFHFSDDELSALAEYILYLHTP